MIEFLFEDHQNDALNTPLDIKLGKNVFYFLVFLHSDGHSCHSVGDVTVKFVKMVLFITILKVIIPNLRLIP